MSNDRITANLPSSDFGRTAAFYGQLGFERLYRSEEWMILLRGPLELEFFHFPDVDPLTSSFSACIRVDDLDGLYAAFQAASLSDYPRATPRLTPPEQRPGIPRMFALIDCDGSLLRCLQNGPEA
jgi:hypothetical protein